MIKTYVRFYCVDGDGDGVKISEVETGTRDETLVVIPASAYAFDFYDVQISVVNGEVVRGPQSNLSKMFYPGGVIEYISAGEISVDDNAPKIISHQVTTRFGDTFVYDDRAQII